MKLKLLKNREIRVFTAVCAVIGGAASAALLFFSPICALICSVLTASLIAAFLVFTARRYKRLAELSDDIGRLISGDDSVTLSKYSEGELSILQNRIEKLVLRLRDQADELKRDKLLLVDSIADISHQIKTPLTSINLLSTALSKQEAESGMSLERQKTISDMRSRISRMDWLVSSLLKLARFDADAVIMNMQAVSLEALVHSAVEPLEIMMELKGQSLSVKADGSVYCDPSWTAEALMNIIKNCSESMEEGELRIFAEENPLYSEIVIHDCGAGIDKDDLPHLFERFYRGRNSSSGGAGIGLALSRSIIVKQNGTVKAENAVEGGAKFTVRFYKGTV